MSGFGTVNQWGGMPAQPWMYACGFRTIIGKLLELTMPEVNSHYHPHGEENGCLTYNVDEENLGHCDVLICAGVLVRLVVDEHTAIIGLSPAGIREQEGENQPPLLMYHIGELVQVNLRASSSHALSIERYFSNVRHMSNAVS